MIYIRKCDKCGKEDKYDGKDEWDLQMKDEEFSDIKLGYQGYGSSMDGSIVDFVLCTDCILEFIKTFKKESIERILVSGDNKDIKLEDWIKEV